ncbi:hypothetical protein ABEB36_002998 [Hypothenemus hampei]|uniref:Malate dehydrogenase, mitochondrial n=1 Tax=Hypothenemus hampei TaxID=57062 RepID=A0ABD1FAU7_HYPHA
MFSRRLILMASMAKRFYCECKKNTKRSVAVIGAAGGVGQPLTLLLKLNPCIGELKVHDIVNVAGVGTDVSHIETASTVKHSTGKDLTETLKGGVDIIVVPAGSPRKPGQNREDLFNTNAQIAFDIAKAMAQHSPQSIILIITNPVNSLVPIVCEVLKSAGKLCPERVLGVSTLDSVRAATFIAEVACLDPKDVTVPLVGGHSAKTIVPLISKTHPQVCIEGEKLCNLIKRIKEAGDEVVKAKDGKGSATLSTAYAASRLVFAILRALNGESNIVESAFVKSDELPDVDYLATPLILGKNGVEKNLGIGKMSEYEQKLFCEAMTQLKKDIELGEKFATDQLCKTKSDK